MAGKWILSRDNLNILEMFELDIKCGQMYLSIQMYRSLFSLATSQAWPLTDQSIIHPSSLGKRLELAGFVLIKLFAPFYIMDDYNRDLLGEMWPDGRAPQSIVARSLQAYPIRSRLFSHSCIVFVQQVKRLDNVELSQAKLSWVPSPQGSVLWNSGAGCFF